MELAVAREVRIESLPIADTIKVLAELSGAPERTVALALSRYQAMQTVKATRAAQKVQEAKEAHEREMATRRSYWGTNHITSNRRGNQ
jgi:HSP20 family molecular chaperone IbpA